jgi:hypothetical protein
VAGVSDVICSEASVAADEPLAGTAPRVDTFLLIEARGAWERDAIDSFPEDVASVIRAWLDATARSRLLLIRRPDRRRGDDLVAFVVRAAESPPSVRRFSLRRLDNLIDLDLADGGEPVEEPLALICGHGRRDPCCARLGIPLYDALREQLDATSLWRSSHQGGHRFAPNLLWLPDGLSFGRVQPGDARSLVAELRAGRLPLGSLRGRVTWPPEAQAAEIAVRQRFGFTRLADVTLLSSASGWVQFGTEGGSVGVEVVTEPGPALPVSCGADPEPIDRYVVSRMQL